MPPRAALKDPTWIAQHNLRSGLMVHAQRVLLTRFSYQTPATAAAKRARYLMHLQTHLETKAMRGSVYFCAKARRLKQK